MKAGEATRLAKEYGCQFKPMGRGVWRIVRGRDNVSLITTSELKCCNADKFVSYYLPKPRKRAA